MKIAFFEDRYFEVYGAQENLLLLAELVNSDERYNCEFITTWPCLLYTSDAADE